MAENNESLPVANERNMASDHKERLVALKDRRSMFDKLQEEVAKYVIPFRQDWTPEIMQGQKHGQHIWDGTPQGALNIFTNGMYGNMVSPAQPWFMLLSGDSFLDDLPHIKFWTQEATKIVAKALYSSNFYREMLPFIADWGSIGTATLYSEMDMATQRIAFSAIHPKQIYIATDQFGFVDTVYREYQISLRNAVAKFGLEGISESHRKMYQDQPFKEIKILHCVYPRTEYDHKKKDGKNKPWASVWVDLDEDKLFRVSGFDDFPYAVGRYSVNSGEDYGRSPAMEALPDIKGLHRISRDLLQASDMRVNPMYNVPQDLKGKDKVKIGSRKIHFFSRPDMVVHPVNSGSDYFVGVDREQRKQQNIREAFHVDFFLMLQSAERGMTATEILERQSEKAIVLSPATGRMTFEVLDKIIARVFKLEYEAGRIPPAPPELVQNGGTVDVTYLGPLAQVQARLFENRGLVNGLEIIAPLTNIWPEIKDNFNPDEIAEVISDSYNMPQKIRRAAQEILELRQARQQALDASRQQIAVESTAKSLKDAGSANQDFDGALQDVAEELASG